MTDVFQFILLNDPVPGVPDCLDCKTVGFFLKISKEIGLTARAYLNMQKYGLFCSLPIAIRSAQGRPRAGRGSGGSVMEYKIPRIE